MNRTAIPLGLAFGSVSGMFGSPVELEKRTKTGVEACWKCWAIDSSPAAADGVKVPFSMVPLPWAGRIPGCSPKIWANVASSLPLRSSSFSSVGKGMVFSCRRCGLAEVTLNRSCVG
jgi:hypothetical protein